MRFPFRAVAISMSAALAISMPMTAGAHGVPSVVAPKAMATLGDSLSAGFPGSASGSWATGTSLKSHSARLKKLYPSLQTYNFASPGAQVNAFSAQARSAVAKGVGYVTVMFGTNDVCNPLGGQPVPITTFRQRFAEGLSILKKGLPNAKIFVVSIPNLDSVRLALLNAGKTATTPYCTRFFANPSSTAESDVQRRTKLLSEIKFFNYVMATECTKVVGCKTDRMVVNSHKWKATELLEGDGHWTKAGHQKISDITWAVGFAWSARK